MLHALLNMYIQRYDKHGGPLAKLPFHLVLTILQYESEVIAPEDYLLFWYPKELYSIGMVFDIPVQALLKKWLSMFDSISNQKQAVWNIHFRYILVSSSREEIILKLVGSR